MSPWRLLLTRPADECQAQLPELAAVGIVARALPMLALKPMAETPVQRSLLLDLDRYSLVIVVSKTAARLMIERVDQYWPQPPARQLWACVGPGTAELLADYGLQVAYPEAGRDSEALWALPEVQAALAVPSARVLLVRGEGGRDWLSEQVQGRGIALDVLELYRREAPPYLPGEIAAELEQAAINGIVLSSAQALEHLVRSAGIDWPELCERVLLVPSERVAELARAHGARRVHVLKGLRSDELLASLPASPEVISFT